MKTYSYSFLFAALLLCICTSGTISVHNEQPDDSLKRTAKPIYARDIIYGSGCINPYQGTGLTIKLSDKPVSKGDSIRGIAYFDNETFTLLARCTKLNYSTNFVVYSPNEKNYPFLVDMKGDTASFTLPYSILQPIKVKGYKNVYAFTSSMEISFFKTNKVIPFDTIITTMCQLQVNMK